MPRMGGLELLRALARTTAATTRSLILTAQGTVETAVEAIKEGAYDYLTKPIEPQRLKILLDKIVERQDTLREVKVLRKQLREHGAFGQMIGSSAQMRKVYQIDRAGGADLGVGADLGRVGHRQGAGGADHPPAQPARAAAVRADQLRGHSRDAARERDLRPREGRLHRRLRSARGLLRAGRSRHAVPRRDRRDDAGHAGEAAARAAGAQVPAPRRPPRAVGGRAGDRRHQRRPARRGEERASCARTCTTGSTSSRSSCRRCASARKTCRC